MEIAEVPIRPDEQGKKKICAKVRQRAEQYLSGKGLTLDRLTDFQKQRIYRYLKARATLKMIEMREKKRIFDAFLPAVKNQMKTKLES